MGRFFQTSGTPQVDYMYNLNAPLMTKVIEANDQYIDEQYDAANKLDALVNFAHTQQDDPAAKAIIDKYEGKITGLTDAIRKDPINWRKQAPLLQGVAKDVSTDYRSGAISKYLSNYSARKAAFDQIDAQVQAKLKGKPGISPEAAAAYKAHWDKQFKGTNYDAKTGTYDIYQGGTAPNDMDIKAELSKGLKDMQDSGYLKQDPTQSGMYLINTTDGWKGITKEQALTAAMGNLSPELKEYMRSRSEVGLMQGAYDAQGNFIEPYSLVPHAITQKEKEDFATREAEAIQLAKKGKGAEAKELQKGIEQDREKLTGDKELEWNDKSMLSPILQSIMGTYARGFTTHKVEVTADQVKLQTSLTGIREAGANSRAQLAANTQILKEQMRQQYETAKNKQEKIDKINANPDLSPEERYRQLSLVNGQEFFSKHAESMKSTEEMQQDTQAFNDYVTALTNRGVDPTSPDAYKSFSNPKSQERYRQLYGMFEGSMQKTDLKPDQYKDVLAMNNGNVFGSYYIDAQGNKYTEQEKKQIEADYKKGTEAGFSLNIGNLFSNIAANISGVNIVGGAPEQRKTVLDTKGYSGKEIAGSYLNRFSRATQGGVAAKPIFTLVPSAKYSEVKSNADKVVRISKSNNAAVKDLGTAIQSDATIANLYYYPQRESETGAGTIALLDKALLNPDVQRTYYNEGAKLFDKNGNSLPGGFSGSIDVPGWNDKSQNNPLEYLAKNLGGNPMDYVKNLRVRPAGNGRVIIGGNLSAPKTKIDGDAFQIVIDNFDGNLQSIFGDSKIFTSSQSGQEIMKNLSYRPILQNKLQQELKDMTYDGSHADINGTIVKKTGNTFEVSTNGGTTFYNRFVPRGASEPRPISGEADLMEILETQVKSM